MLALSLPTQMSKSGGSMYLRYCGTINPRRCRGLSGFHVVSSCAFTSDGLRRHLKSFRCNVSGISVRCLCGPDCLGLQMHDRS